jgi:hypothetical protein
MAKKANVMAFPKPKEEPSREAQPAPEAPQSLVAASRVFEKNQMETTLLTLETMDAWVLPTFQREERQTKKVIEFAEELTRNGGCISGMILLGRIRDDASGTLYLVDGQQRRNACHISGLSEFIGDVCIKTYNSMIEMVEDFKKLQGRLVPFKPDDLLRAFEVTNDNLRLLRESCEFIGYGNIRRAEDRGPILSMSAALRSWFGSGMTTPGLQGQAQILVERLDEHQRGLMIAFFNIAYSAWGRDRQYSRMWGNLNLTMCMYLYRRLVLDDSKRRIPPLPKDMYRKALMSVSADNKYNDWLQGRHMTERDRAPCYKRLKEIFIDRLTKEYNGKLYKGIPKPDWLTDNPGRQ